MSKKMHVSLEEFAKSLRALSTWSSSTAWEDLPVERRLRWLDFARRVALLTDRVKVGLS